MDYLIFDVEISKTPKQVMAELGLKDVGEIFNYPHRCGFSVGVVYNSLTKEYLIFKSAREMATYLLNFDGILVSFNGVRFDIPCLLADIDIDTFKGLQRKRHLDILADFYNNVQGKFRVSLNNISENTIMKVKTGNGANAPQLFQDGKWEELVDYCKNDVQLTKEVFEFGCVNGYINYFDKQNGKKEEMSCDWHDWMIDVELV
jgi:DEAD/DEAH box helicase domain-containing protein